MVKHVILYALIVITFLGAFLLFYKAKGKHAYRFYLGLYFIVSGLVYVGHYLAFFGLWQINQFFDIIYIGALITFYPVYYYFIHKAYGYRVLDIKWILHFTPAIIFTGVMIAAVSMSTWDHYVEYMEYNIYKLPFRSSQAQLLSGIFNASMYVFGAQIILYCIVTLRDIFKSQKELPQLFSNVSHSALQSFNKINIIFLIGMSVPSLYAITQGRQVFEASDLSFVVVGTMYCLTYILLLHAGFTDIPTNVISVPVETTIPAERLDKENQKLEEIPQELEEPEIDPLIKKMNALFETNRLWKVQDINIQDIATDLNTNRSYLSHAINESERCNFNTYVNKFRHREALRMLNDKRYDRYPLDIIGEKAGFGSASTFFRVFKSFEGMTPRQYLRSNK